MNILLITPTSVTIELDNNDVYFTHEYEVYLNDEYVLTSNKNVFSLYNLSSNNEYVLVVKSSDALKKITFKTLDLKPVILKPSNMDDNTKELQTAIDKLLPDEYLELDGTFRVVSIFLKDNIVINLKKGTTLLGSTNREEFPILKSNEFLKSKPLGTWEGRAEDSFSSIITGLGKKNVIIYGEGIVDCNSQNSDWWIDHRKLRIARRPKGIFLHTCTNIVLEGITVCNTPSWNQHPFYSNNISYYNLKLINPPNSPTTDGCDPESCDNVKIIGCYISVGDDCIAIKSGKIDFAKEYKTPSSNIIVRNCFMEKGHAGVTLGSENSGGIQDVFVSKCYFKSTDRGLRIKSQRGRGNLAIIKNISFNNIIMDSVKTGFVINAFYKAGNDVDDYRFIRDYIEPSDITPTFKSFAFDNILCKNIEYGVGFFLGLPESMIEEVKLENVTVSFNYESDAGECAMTSWHEKFKNVGFVVENVKKLILKNVNYLNEPSEKYILRNVDKLED